MSHIPNPFERGSAEKHSIFRKIDPPSSQASLPINRYATWHTWSESFRVFLCQTAAELRRLGPSRLRRVGGLHVYDRTYSWSPAKWSDDRIRRRFDLFARSLNAVRPGRRIMLFDGMIVPGLNSAELRTLFALLRGTLIELAGDERAAMYQPLGEVGKNAGEFPLHADLYIPPMLFNVFDQVAPDDGAASIFLSVAALHKLIPTVMSLPAPKGKAIIAIFERESPTDRFEMLYDLLHGSHRWVRDLEQAMGQRQLRIKLRAGQGYLLHDRMWLHGRDAPCGGVPINRVHRLVFGGRK